MNHTRLIRRACEITWRYKVLWLFGILLALTSGGGGGGNNGARFSSQPIPGLDRLGWIEWQALTGLIVACCCLLVILVIVAVIVNYVARVALYRSVDQIEATGAAPTWREGLRLGWSNRGFRLWLLDLIIAIPAVIIALLLLGIGATPLLLLLIDSPVARTLGIAATVGLELLMIAVIIVAAVILHVCGQFWSREVALADRSIGQALAVGYVTVRQRLKDVGGMWLLMFGIGLAFGLVFLVFVLFVLAVAAAVGGGIGLVVHAITQSVGWAVGLGLPFFLVILVVPTVFVQGLWLVFESSVWTLTYREVAVAKG